MVLDWIRKQFVDVIDWTDEPGVLAIRYPMADKEIQNGAQLTVREGQMAAFINEGRVADVFGPGLHTLETSNLPVLTSIMNWDKAFASPFKSDVYFFSTREQINLKWGTAQPVTVRDKEFGPIRLRAFGSYSFRLEDVAAFSVKLMGSLEKVTTESLEPQLRAAIATALATGLGGSDVPFLDLAANQTLMSEKLKEAVNPVFAQWGLAVPSFFVESVSLPEEVQKYLDKSSSMRVLGDLDKYARFQTAEAIETAAANPGGIAGIGAGAAAGMAIGQAMAGGLTPAAPAQAVPAAPAAPQEDAFAQVEKLHKLLTIGAITQEEFDAKKAELLGRIR
ncbi:SPFH domain-containing protein [Sphingosinicella sp. LHD-64]|uniref:SPFH domain-containing protein n=1 Tax=Sphingosinicella sp. LHD-64 TaxID=3072139 RepID=UPI0028101F11|nr:SPFH domain-containing protein [Sphingosinicella sp. LHD-64]MDQ8754617.1 SPFH domain-containing protein [Sphingosinicella sp. LHD-64]